MYKNALLIFSIFLIIYTKINFIQAAASIEIIPTNPEYPNKCWIADSNKAYSIGEKWYEPGKCEESVCGQLDGKFTINRYSCGVISAKGNCKPVVDRTKQYPDCCPQIVCQ